MIVIYRKSDLRCVGTVFLDMTIEQAIKLNVIPNNPESSIEDYEVIETSETNFHIELINGTVTVVKNPRQAPLPSTEDALANLTLLLMEKGVI